MTKAPARYIGKVIQVSTQNVPQYWGPPPPQYYQPVRTGPPNGLGIAGFVLGLLSILFTTSGYVMNKIGFATYYSSRTLGNIGAGVFWVGTGLGVLAIIFSSIGLGKFRKYDRQNSLAIAGWLLGFLAVVMFLAVLFGIIRN